MNHMAMTNNTIYNEQLSQELTPRVFPRSSYCKENLQFLKNLNFENFDLMGSENNQIDKNLVVIKNC